MLLISKSFVLLGVFIAK